MHSTPPHNDETDETPHISHYPASPKQRRNSVTITRDRRPDSHDEYDRDDEHSEMPVPKVRRASLRKEEADSTPPSTEKVARTRKASPPSTSPTKTIRLEGTSRPPREQREKREKQEKQDLRATRAPRVSSAAAPPLQNLRSKKTPDKSPTSSATRTLSRVKAEEEVFFETFEEDTEHTHATPHTAKILVTQRRRSTLSAVYEPPSRVSHHSRVKRQKQRQRVLEKKQPRDKRWLIFTLATGTLLVLLLITPIIVMNSLHHTATLIFMGSNPVASAAASSSDQTAASDSSLVITATDLTHPAPPVLATSAYLLDADTGATLYASHPFTHLPMLSTTKLMTALLAAEKGNPDQKITINAAISNDINQLSADSSVMGIKKGETYTLRELLYGMFLMSGNDAAIAVADTIGGNLPTFLNMMNQRANQLGLHNTHYMNPHGLLMDGHYSSAHDLAFLGKAVMSIPLLHMISGTKQYHLPATAQHPERYMSNGNQFLWWYPGADGGKPGWDGDVNFIQVVSVTRNNHHLIGVTMHTTDWWTDMRNLMNWGFNNFQWISPHDVDATDPIPYDADWNYFLRDLKSNTIPTGNGGRYYIYTGYSVSGLILQYFDKQGGLAKFGYPNSLPKTAITTVIQKFDHAMIQCDTSTKQCKTL